MAKCVNFINRWTYNEKYLQEIGDKELPFSDQLTSLNDVSERERTLKIHIDRHVWPKVLAIGQAYLQIRHSARGDESQIDCCLARDKIVVNLNHLYSIVYHVVALIKDEKDAKIEWRQRLFIFYTSSIIDKLRRMTQVVGRLSDIDQRLYMDERRKPLVSEESITIHCLTSVWTVIIEILSNFNEAASVIFRSGEDLEDPLDSMLTEDFVEQLEFSTQLNLFCKIFLMDFTITSWIRFNHSAKLDDLVSGIPFLCPCHCKAYLKVLSIVCRNESSQAITGDLMYLILDYKSKPSMMTCDIRNGGVVPIEPCYAKANLIELSYFVVWHLYSLSRLVKDDHRSMISNCGINFEIALIDAFRLFKLDNLSPHQEERFKLLLLMVSDWCERNKDGNRIAIGTKVFEFFNNNWLSLSQYFDKRTFTINRLTVFQMFTKLYDELVPRVPTNNLVPEDSAELTKNWTMLLDKVQPPGPSVAAMA